MEGDGSGKCRRRLEPLVSPLAQHYYRKCSCSVKTLPNPMWFFVTIWTKESWTKTENHVGMDLEHTLQSCQAQNGQPSCSRMVFLLLLSDLPSRCNTRPSSMFLLALLWTSLWAFLVFFTSDARHLIEGVFFCAVCRAETSSLCDIQRCFSSPRITSHRYT